MHTAAEQLLLHAGQQQQQQLQRGSQLQQKQEEGSSNGFLKPGLEPAVLEILQQQQKQ